MQFWTLEIKFSGLENKKVKPEIKFATCRNFVVACKISFFTCRFTGFMLERDVFFPVLLSCLADFLLCNVLYANVIWYNWLVVAFVFSIVSYCGRNLPVLTTFGIQSVKMHFGLLLPTMQLFYVFFRCPCILSFSWPCFRPLPCLALAGCWGWIFCWYV